MSYNLANDISVNLLVDITEADKEKLINTSILQRYANAKQDNIELFIAGLSQILYGINLYAPIDKEVLLKLSNIFLRYMRTSISDND